MFTTLVAVLCHGAVCVEEIVTDSSMDPDITFHACQIHGQFGVADWMSKHPIYRRGWRLDRYKCSPGRYEIKGRV